MSAIEYGSSPGGGEAEGVRQVRAFHYKTAVLRMRLLISTGFMAAGLGLWALAGWGFSGFDAVLGLVVAVYFGIKALFNLGEIVFPRPVIRIAPQGIQDRRLSRNAIPWSAVRQIKEVTGQIGSGTLFLEVDEPIRHVGPSKGLLWAVYAFQHLFQRNGNHRGFVPLSPPVALELGNTTLLEAVQDAAPEPIPVV